MRSRLVAPNNHVKPSNPPQNIPSEAQTPTINYSPATEPLSYTYMLLSLGSTAAHEKPSRNSKEPHQAFAERPSKYIFCVSRSPGSVCRSGSSVCNSVWSCPLCLSVKSKSFCFCLSVRMSVCLYVCLYVRLLCLLQKDAFGRFVADCSA